MSTFISQSVSCWLEELRTGSDAAAQELWNRYFDRLVQVAQRRLDGVAKRTFDEEDVAVSVFRSLCEGLVDGRLEEMRNRDDLWKVLVTITRQKAIDRIRHEKAHKRGGGQVRGESVFGNSPGQDRQLSMNEILGKDPDPGILAEMEEEHQRLLQALGDPILQRVAVLRLQGSTVAEVAETLGVTARTVKRKLSLIRETWLQELDNGQTFG
ncbi:MAG: sigma-70 family RNA polymerase sigma factor [Planctomycetota bacterium]|nr:sigma-70 family RNA polymerase sigma factor [Planctomycetota bacterium]